MNKFHILVITLFGFLLMSNGVFACEKDSAKDTSHKATSSETCHSDCCKKDSHSKTKNHEGCGGKCNHSKCACASSSNTSISISEWDINKNIFNFSSEKEKFYDYETSISCGFNSLWLIPKIG
ncbi:hypothetical protein [Flavobacterium sp. M31R6]|jgi:hypothetical protein|uniref:hypothetical protein n=1 Tax=Flavobacterium sp. M31R6 TaxID=2739062 RepID=UPI00156A3C46|nr:hypothetical protein [Flavobacterium sp. M31R6]QKJ64244.1 hypothetical protein HQN62_14255 [Flavobacterium sp. M31R6]